MTQSSKVLDTDTGLGDVSRTELESMRLQAVNDWRSAPDDAVRAKAYGVLARIDSLLGNVDYNGRH